LGKVNYLEIGAHLKDAAAIETVRYIGQMSKTALNAIGVFTVGDLKAMGIIDAYLRVKQQNYSVSINFIWAMFAGFLGVDFHKILPEFKEAARKELQTTPGETTI